MKVKLGSTWRNRVTGDVVFVVYFFRWRPTDEQGALLRNVDGSQELVAVPVEALTMTKSAWERQPWTV